MSIALALFLNTTGTHGSVDSERVTRSSPNVLTDVITTNVGSITDVSTMQNDTQRGPCAVAPMPCHCLIGNGESFPKLTIPLTMLRPPSAEARFASKRQSWLVCNSSDELGYVRVVFGASDVERQCS